jgi:tetratricopeptide (TPR) repeat protein
MPQDANASAGSSSESTQAMRDELARVVAAPAFAGALAHQRLLRHLVQYTLAGRDAELKETLLGIEVFQRPAPSFDPRRDSIVRVEARRLRLRLRQHYADTPHATLMIVLRSGSYVPQFVTRVHDAVLTTAAELVERGLFFLREGHAAGFRKALDRFEAAVQVAPNHAPAHAGVARAWVHLVSNNLEPPLPGVDLAQAAVQRALRLQPAHADSLVLAAQLAHRFHYNWSGARSCFERALRTAPDSGYVRQALALSLMLRGDFDGAELALQAARRVDTMNLGLRAHQALLWLYRRQWDDAEDTLQALLDLSADNVLGLSLLAYVNLCRGDAGTALSLYTRMSTLHPAQSIGPSGQVWALAALGRTAQAHQQLQLLLQQWSVGRYLSPYQLAMAQCWLGDDAAALDMLQRAVDERDANSLCLPVDPAFDRLAAAPRFIALRRRVLGAGRPQPFIKAKASTMR